jgi:integrase
MENQLTKSLKYQGVYSKKLPNNETMLYIAYTNSNGNYSKYKVGLKSSGISEQYCHNLRQTEITKIRLGENPRLSNRPNVINFHEIAEDYFYNMKLNQCSDTTNSHNKYLNHIKPVFGGINIHSITPQQIHEFKIKKLETHAPATVAMLISFISSIYSHAIKQTKKFKGDNVAFGIERTIVVNNARERYLSLEEIHLLLDVLKSNKYKKKAEIVWSLEYFVRFALSTGARASSILLIKRSNINELNRTVQIYDTKNKSWYTAYLSSKLFPDLSFLDRYKASDYIFYNNRVLTHRIIAYHLRPIYNELFNAGLEEDDWKHRVCNHTLRHTFASHLAINQIPLFEIQKLMNHRDIKMTLRYMKLAEANKVSAVEKIY